MTKAYITLQLFWMNFALNINNYDNQIDKMHLKLKKKTFFSVFMYLIWPPIDWWNINVNDRNPATSKKFSNILIWKSVGRFPTTNNFCNKHNYADVPISYNGIPLFDFFIQKNVSYKNHHTLFFEILTM